MNITHITTDVQTPTDAETYALVTIKRAIAAAEKGDSKLGAFHMALDGMSSYKGRHMLNNIVRGVASNIVGRRARYLEVGSWKGSTLCAATYSNDVEAVAIDNFSQFTDISLGGRDPRHPRDAIMKNLALNRLFSKPQFDAAVLDNDAFAIDPAGLGFFDVYFYDGEHTEAAQHKAFTHFAPALQPIFVAIVDDIVDESTLAATKRAFSEQGWKVHAEWTLYDPCDGTDSSRMEKGWWNGYYVAVVEKGGAA